MTNFTPPVSAANLTEPASIALLNAIEAQDMLTNLSPLPISTTFVHQGQGDPPILLLHGFDSSVLEYRRLLPLLAQQTETWAIDLLGFGFTDRAAETPFTPEAIKTHLYYCWKTLIGRPMVLVGASMGGAAAIDFALTYPECVARLVLIDSVGFKGGGVPSAVMFPPFDRWATAFLGSPRVRQSISRNSYFDPSFASADAQCCAALHLAQPRWSDALIAFTKSGGYGSFRQQLGQIQQPTLILWGDADRILGTKDPVGLQQLIPNSQLVWIAQAGHVPHLEKPAVTADQILQWLNLSTRNGN